MILLIGVVLREQNDDADLLDITDLPN